VRDNGTEGYLGVYAVKELTVTVRDAKGKKHKIIEAISWKEAVGCCVIKGGMRKSNFLEFLQSDSCPELDARKVVIRVRKWRV
jgi:hypothetical protein